MVQMHRDIADVSQSFPKNDETIKMTGSVGLISDNYSSHGIQQPTRLRPPTYFLVLYIGVLYYLL